MGECLSRSRGWRRERDQISESKQEECAECEWNRLGLGLPHSLIPIRILPSILIWISLDTQKFQILFSIAKQNEKTSIKILLVARRTPTELSFGIGPNYCRQTSACLSPYPIAPKPSQVHSDDIIFESSSSHWSRLWFFLSCPIIKIWYHQLVCSCEDEAWLTITQHFCMQISLIRKYHQ